MDSILVTSIHLYNYYVHREDLLYRSCSFQEGVLIGFIGMVPLRAE